LLDPELERGAATQDYKGPDSQSERPSNPVRGGGDGQRTSKLSGRGAAGVSSNGALAKEEHRRHQWPAQKKNGSFPFTTAQGEPRLEGKTNY